MTDWDKRARDLIYISGVPLYAHDDAADIALRVGNEMQAETREILLEKISALEVKILALEELRAKAADARAEEIAQAIELRKTPWNALLQSESLICAGVARATIKTKKTREEVLEEALRSMPCSCAHELETDASKHSVWCNRFVARRALEEAERLNPSSQEEFHP